MRKIIIVGLGIAILVGSFLLSKRLRDSKVVPEQEITKVEKPVYVRTVKNGEVPITISANGNLEAKNKIEIYTEVQGILEDTGKDFKTGVYYKKGETLLRINRQEFYASIQSQRSSLKSLIASIMPDIRIDYTASFDNWNAYLKDFDIGKTTKPLPKPSSDREEYFVSGKNIYTTYFNIKNLEERLSKYDIRAPFSGVLTEVLVTNGTLVRSGQKMGEFIQTSVFELPLSVSGTFADLLRVGKKVTIRNLEHTKTWTGRVSRINSRIDQNSQTVQVFIEVKGNDLREGMYLEADVPTKSATDAIEIDRKLLVEGNSVYTVKDGFLDLVEIQPVHLNENTVVVKGLPEETVLVSKPLSGAYGGMRVKILSETANTSK